MSLGLIDLGIEAVPECLRELTRLTSIYFECNKVKALPSWFADMPGLKAFPRY